jgi:hypothetical protein
MREGVERLGKQDTREGVSIPKAAGHGSAKAPWKRESSQTQAKR